MSDFDPDKYLGGAATATFDPDSYLKKPASLDPVALPKETTKWDGYYAGVEDAQLPPEKLAAFKPLDKVTDNPKEARMRLVNQSYYKEQLTRLPSGSITGAWDTTRNNIGRQIFGQPGDTSEEQLYSLTAERRKSTEFMRKMEWQNATPFEQFRQLMSNFGEHFGQNAKEAAESGKDAFKTFGVVKRNLPTAAKAGELPNMPEMGLQNPALQGFIYRNVAKPLIEGVASPAGVATFGLGGLPKVAQKVIGWAFAAYMGKQMAEATPQMVKVVNDPKTSVEEKGDAIAAVVQPVIMGLASAFGALHEVRPELVDKIEKTDPVQAVELLNKEAANAPVDEAEHLNNTALEISKVAPAPPSDLAQGWDEVKKVFAPASRGPEAAVAAGALREHGADLAQRTDRADAALEKSSKALMKLSPEERWDAVDKIENGEPQESPAMQEFAKATRAIVDTKREEIRALGTGKLEHFIEDYFPHIWKDPEEAATAFQKAIGKAPMEGSKAFLKERTIPTIKEGMALGLEPATNNPVEMVLLKAREMDKYLLGQKWLAEMKGKGLVKFVRSGERPPEGYEEINDKIATVYGNPSHPGAMQIEGHYMAPSSVATVANNYLSPGLRKYASFRAYLTAANSLNQFQLGLSAFHLGFTSIDASISKTALALEYGSQGKLVKAAGAAAKAPIAPVSNMLQGNKVLKEWMQPGSQGEEIGQIVDAIRQAGGRAKMDSFYSTTISKRMTEMFRQGTAAGYFGGVWRAPFAAMEQLSKPIMEYIVPRQKLGVAADLIRMENERMSPTATLDEKREAYGKIWDSVDNRMGQMVYDNLFWNKAAKDMAMASVRSVGWNLGTLRELGGGVLDATKTAKDVVTPGASVELSHRTAYAIALPVMTGILGATYQYMKTGKGPEELRDYFFPKTGEKDPQGRDVRLTIPTYMKDVYHYAHDPVGTAKGKIHPALALMWQMLDNKDYFGREIRHGDDPFVKQMADEAKMFASDFLPIGVRQFQQSSAAGQSAAERAGNFLGVTRAPAWVGETDAEQLAGKLAGDKFKSTSAPDAAMVAKKQAIQVALRSGDATAKAKANAQLYEMVESGELTSTQRRNLVKGTDHTYLENAVSHLDAKEAMRVFKTASPAERADIREAVQKKIEHAHLPAEDKKALMDQFNKLSPDRNPSHTNRR